MSTHDRLEELADNLEAQGEDGLRVRAVRRAREFKRSWVRMAEALVEVRDQGAYSQWGYEDFYSYCANELQIKRATADKLTGSFVALRRHAPSVLARDGLNEAIPTCDAVDYFARALQKHPSNDQDPSRDVDEGLVEELKHAVFEEGAPVTELRKRFNPIFHPKPEGAEEVEALRRASSTVRKLERLLEEIEGLPRHTVRDAQASLEALHEELTEALERTKASYAKAS